MDRIFKLVDVFHSQPLTGNPLAVVFEAEDMSSEEMQRVTRWLNLSETTFVLPAKSNEADYRVRIFTLDREMSFAGHPTLGTCHAWLAAGGNPRNASRIVQECGAGLVHIRRDDNRLAFAAPELIRGGPVDEQTVEEVAQVLRIKRADIVDAQWADNGPGWIAVLLTSADAVLAIQPVRHHAQQIDVGLIGLYPPGGPLAYEVRAIFSDHHRNLIEDPVTGSLNASVAQWLLTTGRAKAPYVATQGACVGRNGRIYIDRDSDGTVWVGGNTTVHFSGSYHAQGERQMSLQQHQS